VLRFTWNVCTFFIVNAVGDGKIDNKVTREISQVQIWRGQHLSYCLETSHRTCHSISESHLSLAADVTTCGKHCIVAHCIALVNEAMDSLKPKRVNACHTWNACVSDFQGFSPCYWRWSATFFYVCMCCWR